MNSNINAFSSNVRQIFERFEFGVQINKMNEKNLLFNVIKKFASDEIDLSPSNIENMQMGYVFEELIRIGAEQANEEAGEHFTLHEVIKLMVNLLLSPETDLRKSHVVKTIYDPACGTGGMLSVAENYIRTLNSEAQPHLFGQDWNDEAYAICRADMLIKGEDSDNIKPDDTFEKDGFPKDKFDYMLANPPFGVEWKQQQRFIENEHDSLGYDGRFGAGLPRINDGSLLFLQHMISKMRNPEDGGSRISIVFNGSPLFTGDAGSGESNIRQWIIENDWLEAIIAMPDQLFYNTGISTYIWIITNRKEKRRNGKIHLIDSREFYVKMRKSLGNKRNQIGDGEENRPNKIAVISKIYGNFQHDETRTLEIEGVKKKVIVSKIFDNADFGYNKITVERPLRLKVSLNTERLDYFTNYCEENDASPLATLVKRVAEIIGEEPHYDYNEFLKTCKENAFEHQNVLTPKRLKILMTILAEKDENAMKVIKYKLKDNPDPIYGLFEIEDERKNQTVEYEPDPDLHDTENVPLKENIEEYFKREVLPHVPDAWIDKSKTKVGYEIPLNRHFFRYEPHRPLEAIEADIKKLEKDIVILVLYRLLLSIRYQSP